MSQKVPSGRQSATGLHLVLAGYSDGGSGVDILGPLVLLAPLAGLAALYTAAAINSNSALVTLATLNTGRKKRGIAWEEEAKLIQKLLKRQAEVA